MDLQIQDLKNSIMEEVILKNYKLLQFVEKEMTQLKEDNAKLKDEMNQLKEENKLLKEENKINKNLFCSDIQNIQSEVKSIVQSEVKSIVQSEVKSIVDNLQTLQTKFDDTNIEGLRVIGFSGNQITAEPKFTFMKKEGLLHHQQTDIGCVCKHLYEHTIIILSLETFKQLHNIYKFKMCDIHWWYKGMRFFNENCEELQVISSGTDYIREPNDYVHIKNNGYTGTRPINFNKKFLKKLLTILDKLNIKLVYDGSELNERSESLRDLIMS